MRSLSPTMIAILRFSVCVLRGKSITTCWRSDDDALLRKVRGLRKNVPKRRERNQILRGHKAWNQEGGPSAWDLVQLYRKTEKKTTIVTCTRKAAQDVNALAATVSASHGA